MSENEADRILGPGWRQPARVALEKAWAAHPERERLEELKRERDKDGEPTWLLWREDQDDGWVEHWLRPVDPLDPREPIRVASWPVKEVEDKPLGEARAVIDEYGDV